MPARRRRRGEDEQRQADGVRESGVGADGEGRGITRSEAGRRGAAGED